MCQHNPSEPDCTLVKERTPELSYSIECSDCGNDLSGIFTYAEVNLIPMSVAVEHRLVQRLIIEIRDRRQEQARLRAQRVAEVALESLVNSTSDRVRSQPLERVLPRKGSVRIDLR